jgi:hypothetical protein
MKMFIVSVVMSLLMPAFLFIPIVCAGVASLFIFNGSYHNFIFSLPILVLGAEVSITLLSKRKRLEAYLCNVSQLS